MRKYIKYEIKGSYKFILGILAIVIIASTIIQGNISEHIKLGTMNSLNNMEGFRGFMLIVPMLVIFGAFLTAFFHIVGSFRKELYEDRGYLTFTLPLTGNQILGGKLIVAMLWFVILGATIILYNLILALILFDGSWVEIAKEFFHVLNTGVISVGLVMGLTSIMTLILIYFSIALSRVSIRNKKIGGIWFIVFLILNALAGYLILKVSGAVPYFLNLNGFKVLHYYELNTVSAFGRSMGDLIIFGGNNDVDAYINIVGALSHIVIGIVAFLGTGYLIEKKIDL